MIKNIPSTPKTRTTHGYSSITFSKGVEVGVLLEKTDNPKTLDVELTARFLLMHTVLVIAYCLLTVATRERLPHHNLLSRDEIAQ